MMGSLEEDIAHASAGPPPDASTVVNDLDIEEEEVAVENREVYLAKVVNVLPTGVLSCGVAFR